jgi:hypothetical protein
MIDLYFPYRLYENYNSYDCKKVLGENITYSHYINLIKELPSFVIKEDSTVSIQNRIINLYKIGKGNKKIFLWSQMHGNEPTGTKFFFDLIQFLKKDDFLNDFRHDIYNNCTIYFIPMVNPDGAEINSRYNALGIDINRDFLSQQTPEGKFLKNTFINIKPEYSFNLHNQSRLYSVTNSKYKPPVLSLMAPPIDENKTIVNNYDNAIRFCSYNYQVLSNFIPGRIAKYPDNFEPRAFGDNFQQLGSTTLLFEAGFWKNTYKFVNKIYFIALLNSIYSALKESYKKITNTFYKTIPVNSNNVFDVIFKNVIIHNDIKIDIGLIIENSKYYIADFGDLSNSHSLQLFNLENHKFIWDINSNSLNYIIENESSIPFILERGKEANFGFLFNEKIVLQFKNGQLL